MSTWGAEITLHYIIQSDFSKWCLCEPTANLQMEREGSMFVYLFVFDRDCLQRWISIHQIQLFCHLPFPTAHVGFRIKMGQPVLWSFILAFNTQWIFTVKLRKKKKIQVTETANTQSRLILTILQTTGGQKWGYQICITELRFKWVFFKRTRGLWWINQECHRSPLNVVLIFDNCVCVNQPHCRHMMTSSFTIK